LDGDQPADLLLEAGAVERWIREARLREGKGTITIAEAAREIGLSPPAIPAAIREGLLDAAVVDESTRVTLASVDRFRERYVPLAQLARRLNTSSSRLVRFVQRHGMQVIRLTRDGECDAEQPIMLRDSQSRVEGLWAVEIAREAAEQKTRVNPGPERSAALAAYLKTMKTKGRRLPNKSKIARACGFQRNEFYMRPELARQLDLAREEQQLRAGQAYLEPIERLRTYLKDLGTSGGQIPLWGGKPKLQAIASACGIDRNIFYKDPEARLMIDNFTWQKSGATARQRGYQ
jgi:AraC-like DNA-binding protein